MNNFININILVAIALVFINVCASVVLRDSYSKIKDLREETMVLRMLNATLERGCE